MRQKQKTKAQGGFPRLSFLNSVLEYTAMLIVLNVFLFQAVCDVICVRDSSFSTLNIINHEINFLFSCMFDGTL